MGRLARAAVKAVAVAVAVLLAPQPGWSQPQTTPPMDETIGYVGLTDDPRFDQQYAYYLIPARPWGPNAAGARLGIVDAAPIGRVIGVNFSLREASAPTAGDLVTVVRGWAAEGVHFVVVDLNATDLLTLSDGIADLPVTLFNISAQEDSLRGENCRFNVVHTIPSYRMETDALMQFLVAKRWINILVLQGPHAEDQVIVDALKQSAAFFGSRITEVRPFVLSADPRLRDQNNVALVTAGGGYDVIWIADSEGEFARNTPYETQESRVVVGSAGLTAEAWHWAWERQGAPQLNDRFEDYNENRRMHSYDWAAWAAVRAVTQSVLRAQTTEYEPVRDFLLGDRMNLDGVKGNPMSVRSWDHQLRQGILIATGNAVVQLAPVEGFLHQTNDLDTLGVDQPQSTCHF
jgi:ABC transporter substrate binding protein (PQQ-dependent alcohol dehydrogenase system)